TRLDVVAGQSQQLPLVTLERADGLVFIRSQPSGANVTINGEYRGLTPMEVALAPGRQHQVTLFHNGFDAATRQVEATSGAEQDISVTLTPITSSVRIIAEPAEAELFVDGVSRGAANQTLSLIAASQIIELRAEGYV